MSHTVRDVQDLVCGHFNISRDQLLGVSRKRVFAKPRQVAMFLAREFTGESLTRLGHEFCRDHTTVLFAIDSTAKIEADASLGVDVAVIRGALKNPAAYARAQFELSMAKSWKRSVPKHLTPGYRQKRNRDIERDLLENDGTQTVPTVSQQKRVAA